jgi:hypothetical protein
MKVVDDASNSEASDISPDGRIASLKTYKVSAKFIYNVHMSAQRLTIFFVAEPIVAAANEDSEQSKRKVCVSVTLV